MFDYILNLLKFAKMLLSIHKMISKVKKPRQLPTAILKNIW